MLHLVAADGRAKGPWALEFNAFGVGVTAAHAQQRNIKTCASGWCDSRIIRATIDLQVLTAWLT